MTEAQVLENPNELTIDQVREYIDKVSEHLGHDITYTPIFPPNRKDVCVVERLVHNGPNGYWQTHVVIKGKNGEIWHKVIQDSDYTVDYLRPEAVSSNGCWLTVKFKDKPQASSKTVVI